MNTERTRKAVSTGELEFVQKGVNTNSSSLRVPKDEIGSWCELTSCFTTLGSETDERRVTNPFPQSRLSCESSPDEGRKKSFCASFTAREGFKFTFLTQK